MLPALITLVASARHMNEHHNVLDGGPALAQESDLKMGVPETHSLTHGNSPQQMQPLLNILVCTTKGRAPAVPALCCAEQCV